MTQSMSRVGCCIDNAPTEGLWGIIKSEAYYITAFSNEEEQTNCIRNATNNLIASSYTFLIILRVYLTGVGSLNSASLVYILAPTSRVL
jgi:transposase InsO family protein